MINQKGIVNLFILVAVIGVIAFSLLTTTAPFKDKFLSSLFPKAPSHASGELFSDSYDELALDPAKWTVRQSQPMIDFVYTAGTMLLWPGATDIPRKWGDPGLYSVQSFNRTPGLAFVNSITSSVGGGEGPVMHFSPTIFPADPNSAGYGISFDMTGTGNVPVRVNAITPGGRVPYAYPFYIWDPTTIKSIDYLTATVLRPQGSYHLITGGNFGTYPDATLIWVNDKGSDNTMYAGISANNGTNWIEDTRVVNLDGAFTTQDGLSVAADNFNRPDSNTLGVTEKGGFTWNKTSGDSRIIGNHLERAGSVESSAIVNANQPEGIAEMTFTTPTGSFADPTLYFRYQDSSNWFRVTCNTNQISLEKMIGGVFTALWVNNLAGCSAGATHRLVVRFHNDAVSVWVDDTALTEDQLGVRDNSLSGAGGAGVGVGANLATPQITSFHIWPKKVTLPESAGSAEYLPVSGNNLLVKDSFTGNNSSSLTNHSMDKGSGWTTNASWLINNNKVSPPNVPSNLSVKATTETGTTEMSASVDITLPESSNGVINDTEWFSGLIVRYKDEQNYVNARFLWQTSSPEIEIWEAHNGVGKFLNAFNVTNLLSVNSTHNLKLVASGNQIAAYLDNVLMVQGVTVDLDGTRAGILIDGGSNSTPYSIFDNFKVTDVSTTLPTPKPSPSPTSSPTISPQPSPSTVTKPGDVDGNGEVDIFDYNLLLTNFNKTGTGVQGDIDGNGKVDIFDYNILLTNFGK